MYSFSSCSFWVMCRGGWQSSVKRRRRCISPSALSWGLHSSCRGRPMILFTIFILTGFRSSPASSTAFLGSGPTASGKQSPFLSEVPLQEQCCPFTGGDKLSRGRCGRPGPPGRGRGRRAAPLCSPLLSLRGRGAGGQASEWPRRGGAGRAGRAAPPLRPGRASAGGTAAAAAASWPRGRSGPIKAGPDRGGRARRGGGCGAAPRGGWWPS